MPITVIQLAARVGQELAGVQRVWLHSALDDCFRAALPPLATEVALPSDAEVAVVVAQQISTEGELAVAACDPVGAARVLAVLEGLEAVSAADILPFVSRLPRESAVRAARIFTSLGVLEVISEGLLIVELAPGLAATDLQRLAEPTLLIDPAVSEMVGAPPISAPD